jgi:hypothetical protein
MGVNMEDHIILYQYLHTKLYKKYGNSRINIKIIKNDVLGRDYKIEKPINYLVIQEMIYFGMLKKINSDSIEIMPVTFNPLKNYNKLALKLGVYE